MVTAKKEIAICSMQVFKLILDSIMIQGEAQSVQTRMEINGRRLWIGYSTRERNLVCYYYGNRRKIVNVDLAELFTNPETDYDKLTYALLDLCCSNRKRFEELNKKLYIMQNQQS